MRRVSPGLRRLCLQVRGRLWWGFADPEPIDLRQSEDGRHGIVARRMRTGWSCRSIRGGEIVKERLSSRVTHVGAYQRTICVRRHDKLAP